ncbi:hypothetical protein HanPI659440_Chr09g0356731 [Helianthus annuus]|nr:hypothetical protein HanPI659440_Chr09g0356731 [Helianthus annuus]
MTVVAVGSGELAFICIDDGGGSGLRRTRLHLCWLGGGGCLRSKTVGVVLVGFR